MPTLYKYGLLEKVPFGKRIGVFVGTLIEEDRAYVHWLLDNTDFRLNADALKYLEDLDKEDA